MKAPKRPRASHRLLILAATAAGACAIAVPATLGLSGNPSFSQRIHVRVPSSADLVVFDDHGRAVEPPSRSTSAPLTRPVARPRPATSGREAEPGDDRSEAEPGDDRRTPAEPGDDRASRTRARSAPSRTAEPVEHHRGRDVIPSPTIALRTASSSSDDHSGSGHSRSGHGGSGGDDGTGHSGGSSGGSSGGNGGPGPGGRTGRG